MLRDLRARVFGEQEVEIVLWTRPLLLDFSERRVAAEQGQLAEKWSSRGTLWLKVGTKSLRVGPRDLFDELRVGRSYRAFHGVQTGRLAVDESGTVS